MKPDGNKRLFIGTGILALSVILPLFGAPLVALLAFPPATTALISGFLLVTGEVLGIISVAVMGKDGYVFIKRHILQVLKKYGPPRHVSRRRYRIGLIMFCLPILFGWLSIYVSKLIPGFIGNPLPYAVAGDLLLIASLFVLGGEFWDKLQSLFRHDEVHNQMDHQDL